MLCYYSLAGSMMIMLKRSRKRNISVEAAKLSQHFSESSKKKQTDSDIFNLYS